MHRLRELRKEKHMTQEELANAIHVTKLTISNWENDKHPIKSEKVSTLADYFGVSIPYLLGLDDHYKLPIPQKLTDELYLINLRKAELLREYLELDKQEQDIINQIKEIQK
ncbi:helix-turn-helix domain-containing protein [Streptococcus suis]|uniref:helix-turn-helix domain-containing protein n=1 Tax=Streptococcus suis TaxID=1307 RepID=UPI000CF59EA9|nr:helix-turn-helix transcriptional regulator [Streptococcus suis]NQN16460.1 helix-turn-helix transcriptional regulator [Streptococcus suis]HEL2301951.1 helix-turn-helix transcriptional regulator [Streptococcus suis]HEL2511057.1 helix-turn-helix transcriptional regulator [Streptococcus suis]HEL2737032.1 helix-turn-helix transcriptional regulator [Streptococcus suis]HEM2651498.1 helix-turn-helix transcriptional regulator [Streptococcus suis]